MPDFYSWTMIKETMDCKEVAKDLGLVLDKDGRCAAAWRNGKNKTSVAINERGWHDFATEESGSVIDLVSKMRKMNLQAASMWIGDTYHLQSNGRTRQAPQTTTRYDALLAEGYAETNRYKYTDAQGNLISQVVRMEHVAKKKEFLQCDASGRWGVSGIDLVLYNLPSVSESQSVIVVEGEKDADTLISMGFVATTNCGGAKKWNDSYTNALAGKDVILMPDNDEVGIAHLGLVGRSLKGMARSIKFLIVSSAEKGDVTDWIQNEGGTKKKLEALLKKAKLWVEPRNDDVQKALAKEANETPLRNFTVSKVVDGDKVEIKKEPKSAIAITEEIMTRFLRFPRKIGDVLFDHDRDSGRIEYLLTPSEFFAWMQVKGKILIDWNKGASFVARDDTFNAVKESATRYESIANVPDWPVREDTYYTHDDLPAPSQGAAIFNGLIDFFNPASPEFRILLKALFTAPLFYVAGIPRPIWIIDSEDGAGTGKTTVAEILGLLYDSPIIRARRDDLSRNINDLNKRLVSSSGRMSRIFLLDNITGSFHSEALAEMATQWTISGRPAYGRGEESRPNNLTYIVTANSAQVDNDLADRAYPIMLKKAEICPSWKRELLAYVKTNRLQIFADMLDILTGERTETIKPETRFPEFEVQVLYPHCVSKDTHKQVLLAMAEVRESINSEGELAEQIKDKIASELDGIGGNLSENSVFIPSSILKPWIVGILHRGTELQHLSNMTKNGLIDGIEPITKLKSAYQQGRKRGWIWSPDGPTSDPDYVVSRHQEKLVYYTAISLFNSGANDNLNYRSN